MISTKWRATGVLSLAALIFTPALSAWQGADAAAADYKRMCAGCHGADGSGNTAMGRSFKMRDLRSGDVQKMHDSELSNIIANGKGKMPAYKAKLSEEKIEGLVRYIRQLAKSK
jgi:cytochrome c6